MAGLVSVAERAVLTGIFEQVFETFSRNIVIYKEPIKVLRNVNQDNFSFGFGEEQGEDSFTYSEVTGVYPAKIRYGPQIINLEQNTKVYLSDGEVSIKVREDCRNFINSGITEKFVFDDRTFILNSDEKKRSFLDSKFYVFTLKAAK